VLSILGWAGGHGLAIIITLIILLLHTVCVSQEGMSKGGEGCGQKAAGSVSLECSQSVRTSAQHGEEVYSDAAGAQPMFISSILCYIVGMRGVSSAKDLKDIIMQFYSNEQVCVAKEQISNIIRDLKLDGIPTCRKRYFSKEFPQQKADRDVDDLLGVFTHLDEQGQDTLLPTFVVDRPNVMPTRHIMEGELGAVLANISQLDAKCASLQITIDKLTAIITTMNEGVTRGPRGADAPPTDRVGPSTVWRGQAPLNRLLFARQGLLNDNGGESDGTSGQSEGDMTEVLSKRKERKKRKLAASPPNLIRETSPTTLGHVGHRPSFTMHQASVHHPMTKVRPKPLIIGSSNTPSLAAASSLYLHKGVYRIANVGGSSTVEGMQDYLKALGIRVMSCFDRTPANSRIENNKIYRVCILNIDRPKLLNSENWATGIDIQNWVFDKKKQATAGGGGATPAPGLIEDPSAAIQRTGAPLNSAQETERADMDMSENGGGD